MPKAQAPRRARSRGPLSLRLTLSAQSGLENLPMLPKSCCSRVRSRPSVGVSRPTGSTRSEEHTSELQSIMRNSYAVFCLKKEMTSKYINTVVIDILSHLNIHMLNESRRIRFYIDRQQVV